MEDFQANEQTNLYGSASTLANIGLVMLKRWSGVMRLPFLALSVVVVFLGSAMAWYDGSFNPLYAGLTLLGLISAHAVVNILNEYSDFRNGVDFQTIRTPFSGGSGILPSGLIKPQSALMLARMLMIPALAVGIFFIVIRGLWLLPILLVGVFCILLYDRITTKMGWVEWAPGLGLGSLAIVGSYFVQTGSLSWGVVLASIPSGILAHNLLLLNEFPDVGPDRQAGRRSLPIMMGRHRVSLLYSRLTLGMYLWIVLGTILPDIRNLKHMPVFCLLALLTLPFALKAIRGAESTSHAKLVSAMGANVGVVLLTQILLGIGYILGRIV
jgi:1,4-dihydroxy-2-naphthoate polyprenyltransferase